MLECLINYYTDGNKSEFGRKIGVTPQTINSWLIRDSLDLELVYARCEGVSAEWLLSSGEDGEMIASETSGERKQRTNNHQTEELLQLCKLLIANFQQRDIVVSQLMSMVKKMEL